MKNFLKVFGFIIALCFTLTAFSAPPVATHNYDVGFSCVNQTFLQTHAMDFAFIPAPVTANVLVNSRINSDYHQMTSFPDIQFSRGIYRLDIGETSLLNLINKNTKQSCYNQFKQGIYSPNIGYNLFQTGNPENRFTALFDEADAEFTHLYAADLSKLNPEYPKQIIPVPLL